ncbi:MAG: hypothetical protein IPF46_16770 [Saprospiraceae bacterium]|nr:hypothetical protein [Candidatus Vicinibacter affinis]
MPTISWKFEMILPTEINNLPTSAGTLDCVSAEITDSCELDSDDDGINDCVECDSIGIDLHLL